MKYKKLFLTASVVPIFFLSALSASAATYSVHSCSNSAYGPTHKLFAFLPFERAYAVAYVNVQDAFGDSANTVECGDFVYQLSLNKSTYAVNENINVSGTYTQGVCSNGQNIGSEIAATNNLDSVAALLVTAGNVNWGLSGATVFQAGPIPTTSGVGFGGSFYYSGQTFWWFNIATISYTVVSSAPPTVDVHFSFFDKIKSFISDTLINKVFASGK